MFHDKSGHRIDRLFLEHKALALVPAPGPWRSEARFHLIRKPRPGESEQLASEIAALVVGCHEQLIEIAFAKKQREHRGELSLMATKRLQPFSISIGARARNFASRKLLACSRPVETQLSIQTRETSSYSSRCAGRIRGGGMDALPEEIR